MEAKRALATDFWMGWVAPTPAQQKVSETDLDRVMTSFNLSQCHPHQALVEIVQKHMQA